MWRATAPFGSAPARFEALEYGGLFFCSSSRSLSLRLGIVTLIAGVFSKVQVVVEPVHAKMKLIVVAAEEFFLRQRRRSREIS